MLISARLTLKQHRFEVGAAVLAALVLGALALIVDYRLRAINVPGGCFEAWLSGGGADGAGDCSGPVQAFAAINEEEAGKVLAAMAVLPFVIGLLAGVPIVGRELESRTVQTAWSLSGSRLRWLMRQLAPIAILAVVAVTFAALAANGLEATRQPWYHSGFSDVTLHGPPVVGRAVGALGLGLLLGAWLGRTLPAFIVGALVSLILVSSVSAMSSAWLDSQKAVIPDVSSQDPGTWAGIQMGSLWLAPDGTKITDDAAFALVPSAEPDPYAWLHGQGYRDVLVGVPQDVAMGWATYDVLIFGLIGAASLGGAMLVVDRRRPT
jgi:hypothetical protein